MLPPFCVKMGENIFGVTFGVTVWSYIFTEFGVTFGVTFALLLWVLRDRKPTLKCPFFVHFSGYNGRKMHLLGTFYNVRVDMLCVGESVI